MLRLTEIRGHDALTTSSLECHAPVTDVIKSASDVNDDTDHTQSALRQRLVQVRVHFIVLTKARFPFKCNRLRCVNENRKKRKHLRWQAANHGCYCFDRVFLLAGACVCCVKNASACVSCGFSLRSARNASDCV